MFGRKSKDKNKNKVVLYHPNESDAVAKGEITNSLAVFAQIEAPNYNNLDKEDVAYNADRNTQFHIVNLNNMKKINTNNYYDCGNYKEEYDFVINLDTFDKKINPLVKKIIINLDNKNPNPIKILLNKEKYAVYGRNFKNYDINEEELFDITILIFSGCENKIVEKAIKINLKGTVQEHKGHPSPLFYKNPYFLRSLFNFMRGRIDEEITKDIFENLRFFDNEIKL